MDLNGVIAAYVGLECGVQRVVADLSAAACAACGGQCCREEICRESVESPFLRAVIAADDTAPGPYDERAGWMRADGCALAAGRPPVCYEYACSDVTDALHDSLQVYLYEVVSYLLTVAGEQVAGRTHAVELLDADDLAAVDCDRWAAQVQAAEAILDRCRGCLQRGRVTAADLRWLARVRQPPADVEGMVVG